MKQPTFYFLLLLGVYCCVFFFPSFWLLLPAFYALFILSTSLRKSLFWFFLFNGFILFWIAFIIWGGKIEEALQILWRSNVLICTALGLYCDKEAMFIAQSLHGFLPQKCNTLIFLSAKLIEELKEELALGKRTLQVRSPSQLKFKTRCKTYGYMIGKILCHGLLRAQQLALTLEIRGYDGGRMALIQKPISRTDQLALGVLILSVILGTQL